MSEYDLIVVGGGPAGLVASAEAARIGARVALIEQHQLGGDWLWTGCVPSKALIASAYAARAARTAGRFGVRVLDPRVDFARVVQWMRRVQRRVEVHDALVRARAPGVDVVRGAAHFVGEHTLWVDGRVVSARRVVIATGSKPAVPPIDGLSKVPFHTNETIFSLKKLPERLVVLGAGPIGLELAQAFARLGTIVRLVEDGPHLLPREEEELSTLLHARLAADGVELQLGTTVTRVAHESGTFRLCARRGDGAPVTIEGDTLLVATGRVPNVGGLETERAGVETGRAGVVVDARLRTTANGVWAAGDVTGALMFTHVADYHARLVVRNAFLPLAPKVDYSTVPWVIFSEPELAHVGLTEREARERHGDGVRVWRRRFSDVDRAITDGEIHGMVKLVTDRKGKILGGHILGRAAGSMLAEIALAMKHGISAAALGNVVHAYPTYPEAVQQAADGYTQSRLRRLARRIGRRLGRET